jgi:hypothetical protein
MRQQEQVKRKQAACLPVSRMALVSWPYGVRLVFFATEIMQQAACCPA